jgi:hypothetical protein
MSTTTGNGRLSKNLIGGSLDINGKNLVDGDRNIRVENATIEGDLEVKGDLTINSVTLSAAIETAVSATTADTTNTQIAMFTGTTVTVGDVVEHILFTQVNHARSILELKVFIHDINSDTFWRYSDGKYMWYREWTNPATELVIGTPVNIGSGDPLHYVIERMQTDNVISVRITQNTPYDTNTKYKIIAKIIQ